MKIECSYDKMVPIEELTLHDKNRNKHSEEQIKRLAQIMLYTGWRSPVKVSNLSNKVVAGHCRIAAAKINGWDSVPVDLQDFENEQEEIAHLNADNAIALWSDLDIEAIKLDVADLPDFDIDMLGIKGLSLGELPGINDGNTTATKLTDRFLIPPFSVLDGRQGYWLERKRAWLALGIRSELGRDAECLKTGIGENYGRKEMTGTSIFDPVLCEIAYRWFTPENASILDPFAGGSVRGIIASLLGRKYIGVDLRKEQVDANKINWEEIKKKDINKILENKKLSIKISSKSMQQIFQGCTNDFVKNVCNGSCCRSSTNEAGILVTIHPSEKENIINAGGEVENNLLKPQNKRCPFQNNDNLCDLHTTDIKPFGCIVSPFTLNKNNTLIVRNRYRLLKCFNHAEGQPAYKTFSASLIKLFGIENYNYIKDHFDNNGGDLEMPLDENACNMLKENDQIKKGEKINCEPGAKNITYKIKHDPMWVVGDSAIINSLAPGEYDFIFSCPPYGDLEIYSDDARDISSLEYTDFVVAYKKIIQESIAMLKNDRFACFVVGDIRDKNGFYRNFVSHTIDAFQEAGAVLYNEAILVTPLGSLPIRASKIFQASRKLGKTHQNVLIFCKGDPKKAAENCGNIKIYDELIGNHE